MIYVFERRWMVGILGSSMLERTSRFVLEVLPYVASALIAAFVVPAFLYSQVHATQTSPVAVRMFSK